MINELTGREDESVGGPYTIQLGAFRSVENARRLAAGFEKSLYQARLETADIKGLGVMHRVRVSFFKNLETAREAAVEFMRSGNRDIWIVGLDGRDWAVQLAAFSSREKAGSLVAAVDEPGLYAWIEDTPQGIYRVKVGYWADRLEAEKAAAGLSARLKLEPKVIQVR
jgi:cell division septation protein DedD